MEGTINAIPRWAIAISLAAIVLFMGLSLVTGKPFKVFGYEFGFDEKSVESTSSQNPTDLTARLEHLEHSIGSLPSNVNTELGQAITRQSLDWTEVSFRNHFDRPPRVFVTTVSERTYGYPVVYDVTANGFKVRIEDAISKDYFTKPNVEFYYLAMEPAE